MPKDLDKIKDEIMSLDFNEKVVERLSQVFEEGAFQKAGIAKMLRMCLKAKKVFKNLKIVDDEIESGKKQLVLLKSEISRIAQKEKDNTKTYHEHVSENAEKLQEKQKEDIATVNKTKRECSTKVNKYMTEADEKIRAIEKNIRAAEKREQVANAKADAALARKEEILESLK